MGVGCPLDFTGSGPIPCVLGSALTPLGSGVAAPSAGLTAFGAVGVMIGVCSCAVGVAVAD